MLSATGPANPVTKQDAGSDATVPRARAARTELGPVLGLQSIDYMGT